MALTTTARKYVSTGNKKEVICTLAFDSSYPTGGEAITAAILGLAGLDFLQINDTATYIFVWDTANSKILAYTRSDGAQVANDTDLASVTTAVRAIGH